MFVCRRSCDGRNHLVLDSATRDDARWDRNQDAKEDRTMPDGISKDGMTKLAARAVKRLLADELSPSSCYVDVVGAAWETSKFPGIQHKVLYDDKATGMSALLFKLAPGAVVPLHEHTAIEMTYVLEGTLEDDEGVCTAGNFVWRPAGSTHEAVAPNGALILGIFMKPNYFAAGQKFFTEQTPS
jgi:quercetin dioxygenase-like cupin family protein